MCDIADKSFEVFVKAFVDLFGDNLKMYEDISKLGTTGRNKYRNSMDTAQTITDAALSAHSPFNFVQPIAHALIFLGDIIIKNTLGRREKVKATNIWSIFETISTDAVRHMVIKAGAEIFGIFEYNFIRVQDKHGNHSMALKKLALDAVQRIMNYLSENIPNVVDHKILVKGVLLGKSDPYFKKFKITKGYSLCINELNIRTSQIYESNCLVTLDKNKGIDKYVAGDFLAYLFRLHTDFDVAGSESFIDNDGKFCYQYKYVGDEYENAIKTFLFNEVKIEKNEKTEKIDKEVPFLSMSNSFTGRTKELDDIHKKLINATCVAIVGLGGVGKTELAKKYISEYRNCFKNIFWINADNYHSLVKSFKDSANKLDLKIEDVDVKLVVNMVYTKLSESRSLLVFDNAQKCRNVTEQDSGIDMFLPPNIGFDNLYVLITSNNSLWDSDICTYTLKELRLDEAIEFIRKEYKHASTKDVRNLAERLQGHPLALKQALSYIKERSIGEVYSIQTYLQDFDADSQNLLDIDWPEHERNIYSSTVYKTLSLTIEYIKTKKEGSLAIDVLNRIAYLAADDIPIDMFTPKEVKVGPAIGLLKKYSLVDRMVDNTGNFISVHRLVQEVVKIYLVKSGDDMKILDAIFSLVQQMKVEGINAKEVEVIRKSMLHLEAFYVYLKDRLTKVAKTKEPEHLDQYYVYANQTLEVINMLSISHLIFCNAGRTKVLALEALRIIWMSYNVNGFELERISKILGLQLYSTHQFNEKRKADPNLVTAILNNLANAFSALGDEKTKKKVLEVALKIDEQHYDVNNFSSLPRTLNNIGNVYGALNDQWKKIELLNRALKIYENKFGCDHNHVAKVLNNLATAYGAIDYQKKKQELLERALAIEETNSDNWNYFRIGIILQNLVEIYRSLGDHDNVLKLRKRILQIYENHHGSKPSAQVVRMLINLAASVRLTNDIAQEQELLEKALDIKYKLGDDDDLEVADIAFDLARICGKKRDHKEEKELLQKALNIYENKNKKSKYADTLICLAHSCREVGDYESVASYLAKALEIYKSIEDVNDLDKANVLTSLAMTMGILKRSSKQNDKRYFELCSIIDFMSKNSIRKTCKKCCALSK